MSDKRLTDNRLEQQVKDMQLLTLLTGCNILRMHHSGCHEKHRTTQCLALILGDEETDMVRQPVVQQHDLVDGMHGSQSVTTSQVMLQYLPEGKIVVRLFNDDTCLTGTTRTVQTNTIPRIKHFA